MTIEGGNERHRDTDYGGMNPNDPAPLQHGYGPYTEGIDEDIGSDVESVAQRHLQRREREEQRMEKEREEEEERQRRIRLRIAKANAEVNKRPPVPMPPAPLRAESFKRKGTSGNASRRESAGSSDNPQDNDHDSYSTDGSKDDSSDDSVF